MSEKTKDTTTSQESKMFQKEQEILNFWESNEVFKKSLNKGNKGDFSFYDGPPFANGLPHYGHIVASVIKDVIPRYKTMNGYNVRRKWGWDCHGLPVENEVEKELGLNGKKEILDKYSISQFNELCRTSVMKYADEWRKFIPMIGRFVDMEDDYKTMDINYMESVWWVFKELYKKGLIYEGYKSMHICPRCGTTLSNFEVAQGYKDIKDISVTAKFELVDEPGTFVLAWTTTPWTLPGNVALAVNSDIDYVKVRVDIDSDKIESHKKEVGESVIENVHIITFENIILAKELLEKTLNNKVYEIIDEFKGKELISKSYKPLFDYFVDKKIDNYESIYKIYSADFVTTEDGTGIVHIAPAFGEDDMNLAKEKHLPFIQHVSPEGKFTSDVVDFSGLDVKKKDDHQGADIEILKYLSGMGLVFSKEKYEHSYPHCWRCDSPLLNYATGSWFVEVTKIKDDLVKANKKTNWIPDNFKEGRFGKWLEGARDWSISRNRFWGAPIPVWKCVCGEVVVYGSKEELETASGKKIDDLHKHFIDNIKISCPKCGGMADRIPEVFDCWFESGSMPYASVHYPFENKKWFEDNFPAQFIAEGQDQTRGWFYTLMVLGTALFNKPAFMNVVVNGMVLAEDGKKMSKRLKNYPEPNYLIKKYCADVLRFYLLSSPVVRGGDLCFSEKDLSATYARYFLTLSNIVSFYNMYKKESDVDYVKSENILDKWILIKLKELKINVTLSLESYDLKKASDFISDFILELSTWYLRRSRDRFKDGDIDAPKTMNLVLLEFSKIIAPFIPFTAEGLYKDVLGKEESVHLLDWPVTEKLSKEEEILLSDMERARLIVEKTHKERDLAGIKVRQVLSYINYGLGDKALDKTLEDIIRDEVNVETVSFDNGIDAIYLHLEITPELKDKGDLREFVRNINSLRKEVSLTPKDEVIVYINNVNNNFVQLINDNIEPLKKDVLAKEFIFESAGDDLLISKEVKINDFSITIGLK